MGLREKVALLIAFITLIQITFVSCSVRDKAPTKTLKHVRRTDSAMHSPMMVNLRPFQKGVKFRKRVPDKNHEAILKTFNFPDIEYPAAGMPRPPFHLQEPNILQKNPVQRAAEFPTTTIAPYSLINNMKYNKKYNKKLAHLRARNPEVTVKFPEFGTTPKPYCFREEGTFPEVEYPLSAKDTWKPNYWKHIPSDGFQSQANKNDPENTSNTGSNVKSIRKTSIKAIIDAISDYKKTVPKNSSSINNNQNIVNTNQQVSEKSGRNSLIMIDVSTPTPTTNKVNDQNTTPSPNLSVSLQSTTPFVLTPYTTIYFDTTFPSNDVTTSKDESKSKTLPSKKKRKKKITVTKKEESSTRSKKISLEETEPHITPSIPAQHEKVTKNNTYTYTLTKTNVSELDTCGYMSDDKLTSTYLVTTSYFNNTNLTTALPFTIHNDEKMPHIPSDKVASTPGAINATELNSSDKGSLCVEDNVINSNNSLTCEDKSDDSPLSSRESDEEFTTDVIPDFDESLSPAFTISTSTLPPLSSIEEAWDKTEVIDPYKSLSYPDELEEMYILVR